MDKNIMLLLAADAILLLHVVFVTFVVLGLVLILIGKFRHWSWVHNPWWRLAHIAAITVVVLQSWLGSSCPLTKWEMSLRSLAGDTVYTGSFIANWLGNIFYYRVPVWVFVVCYTIFGAVVIVSWFWVRPRPFRKISKDGVTRH